MIIKKKITWVMGHALTYPYEGPCTRLHGHNWEVEFAYEGPIDNKGMVLDFAEFRKMKQWIDQNLDHLFYVRNTHLLLEPYIEGENEYSKEMDELGIVPVSWNPTSENMAIFIHEKCCEIMNLDSKSLTVTIWETCTSSATYKEE